MDDLSLLMWTLGLGSHLPTFPPSDEERLYHLLSEHRLLLRFLHRVEQQPPRWCSEAFITRLREDQATVEAKLERELQFMRELTAALPSARDPLILVKGLSVYALVGDPFRLSPGADLDLFYPDPEALCEALTALGLEGERPTWRAVWSCPDPGDYGYTGARTARPHEYAEFSGDRITVDVHSYYPVLALPMGVGAADLAPGRHPGHWEQRFPALPAREIRYDDLRDHSMAGTTPATRDLVVPDPNLAVLILCAHEFRSAIHPPVHHDLVVQFGKMADVHDLVRHPRFERSVFLDLVERFSAHDSALFLGGLLERYFGTNPLPAPGSRPASQLPAPRLVTWFGGWATLTSVDEYFSPPSLSAIIRRMLPYPLVVSATPPERQAIPRLIVQSESGDDIPFSVAVHHDGSALHCEVHLPEPLPDDDFLYHVHLYGDPYETVTQGANIVRRGMRVEPFGPGRVSRFCADGGYTVQLSLSLDALPPSFGEGEPVPMVLLVSKWFVGHPPPYVDPDPVVVAPLELVRAQDPPDGTVSPQHACDR